ncbi:MAG: hypothetical protein JWP87_1339 [Labilithrix sp.]|nr:hypothetical protein [Labilithrix sp.]
MQNGTSTKSPLPSPLAHEGPPSGVNLFTFARISAAAAEIDRPLAEILAKESLTDAQWTEVTLFWARRMGEDARNAEPRVALAFSDAFAKAQDALKPVVVLSPEAWDALVLAIDDAPDGPARVLAERGLGMADFSRLTRHWARALARPSEGM